MVRILTLLLAALLIFSVPGRAQNTNVELHGLGALQTADAFVGYYTVVKTDKPEKGKVGYMLTVLDPAMNKVAEKALVEDDDFYFAGSAFDGAAIIVKFLGSPGESKEAGNRQLVRLFDTKLNPVRNRTSGVGRLKNENQAHGPFEESPYRVLPASGGGFLSFNAINTQPSSAMNSSMVRDGYYVEYVPADAKTTGWRYKSPENRFEIASYLGHSDRHVFFATMEKEKIFDYSLDKKIAAFDRKTGRKTLPVDSFARAQSLTPVRAFSVPGAGYTLLTGVYHEQSKNEVYKSSLGLFAVALDSGGRPTTATYTPWAELGADAIESEGKDVGRLRMQDVVRLTDGRIFLIGERFSGAGVSPTVGNVLSRAATLGTTGSKRVTLGDLVIVELTSDLKLTKVHSFNKPSHAVDLFSAIAAPSAEFQMYYYQGLLDYRFSQVSADGTSFAVYYDVDKGKDKADLGAIVYRGGKFSEDKLPLTVKKDALMVLPNEFGSVGIFEYDKKGKSLGSRVVKVNY